MNTAAALKDSGMDATTKTPAAAWRAYQGVTTGAIDEKELIEHELAVVEVAFGQAVSLFEIEGRDDPAMGDL